MIDGISGLNNDLAFLEVRGLCRGRVFLKVEALNPAGSIKLKAAAGMIGALEREGRIRHGTRLIESSSGNLGVALAAICAERGYDFTCVIDPNTSEQNRKVIEAFGAKVFGVENRDTKRAERMSLSFAMSE